jgi:hypothetical protein
MIQDIFLAVFLKNKSNEASKSKSNKNTNCKLLQMIKKFLLKQKYLQMIGLVKAT